MQIDTTAAEASRQSFWTGENGLWMPPQRSTTAHEIDALFNFILYASALLTVLVTVVGIYFVWKYRRRSHADRPVRVQESKWLELSWIVLPTLLVLVIFFWGFRAYVGTSIPPTNAIEIDVRAYKWAWDFKYANGVETFGEVYVPVGQPVQLRMTSSDVLHSFYVPEFRVKHDVVPNRYSYVWFEATEVGVYQVVCTEYCGTAHSNMGAKIHVVSQADYYRILRDGPPSGGPVAPADLGLRLFTQRNCNTCHSIDGSTGIGPTWQNLWMAQRPLTNGQTVVADEAYLDESVLLPQAKIVAGYANGNMPAYDLNEEQLAGLAAYIRVLSGAATAADTTLAEAADAPAATN